MKAGARYRPLHSAVFQFQTGVKAAAADVPRLASTSAILPFSVSLTLRAGAECGSAQFCRRDRRDIVSSLAWDNESSMAENFKVFIETTKGNLTVEVKPDWAPIGAERFKQLVESGFYDGAKFFRVLPGFIVQFGLAANPADNGKWDKRLADDPVKTSNKRGTITYATAGPGTRTTQVFINFGDNNFLDRQGFSPFGEVIEGLEVAEQFYSGYGEGAPHGKGPDQASIRAKGNAYLEPQFPNLDGIIRASIIA